MPRSDALKRLVREQLEPVLLALGFQIVFGDEKGWTPGSYFSRRQRSLEQVIMIDRDKFGKAIGLNFSREQSPGKYEYLDWKKLLPPADLRYETTEELLRVLMTVRTFIEGTAVPWLEAPR